MESHIAHGGRSNDGAGTSTNFYVVQSSGGSTSENQLCEICVICVKCGIALPLPWCRCLFSASRLDAALTMAVLVGAGDSTKGILRGHPPILIVTTAPDDSIILDIPTESIGAPSTLLTVSPQGRCRLARSRCLTQYPYPSWSWNRPQNRVHHSRPIDARHQNNRHRRQVSGPLKANAAAQGIMPIIASASERRRRKMHPVPWCRGVLE